jgi:hypothetical protein
MEQLRRNLGVTPPLLLPVLCKDIYSPLFNTKRSSEFMPVNVITNQLLQEVNDKWMSLKSVTAVLPTQNSKPKTLDSKPRTHDSKLAFTATR